MFMTYIRYSQFVTANYSTPD